MDAESWKELHGIVKDIASPLISVIGVWIGWKLGTLSQRRQQRLDSLQKRLESLSEIMSVANDIPPNLDINSLKTRFAADPEFFKRIAHRLVRIFGLRTELAPYIEPEIRRYIDNTLREFYVIGGGHYDLLPDKEEDFARAAIELRKLLTRNEERIISEYEKLTS